MSTLTSRFIKRAEELEDVFDSIEPEKDKPKKKNDRKVQGLLNDKGVGPFLGDLTPFTSGAFGSTRAGRAAELSNQLGKDPGLMLSYPKTSRFLAGLAGLAGGAVVGTAGAAALSGGLDERAVPGGVFGGLAGWGLGYLGTNVLLNRKIRGVGDQARAALAKDPKALDQINRRPIEPSNGMLRFLSPLGGWQRAGRAQTLDALRENRGFRSDADHTAMGAIHGFGGAVPVIGAPGATAAGLVGGYTGNLRLMTAIERAKESVAARRGGAV